MQLTFGKVVLLKFDRAVKSGKARFSAALTAPVKKAMGWEEIADWETSCTPKGRLVATRIELEPKPGMGLSGKAVELETSLIDSFELIKIEAKGKGSKKTKSVKIELRFNVTYSDVGGAGKLEKYLLTTGNEGAMNVVYEKEAENQNLEGMDEETDTRQGELEHMVEDVKKKRGSKEVN